MTPTAALNHVTDAAADRLNANAEYRLAIIAARQAGATLREIADAAGTGAPNVLRIIQRNTKGDTTT